jgi:hypothetical protein
MTTRRNNNIMKMKKKKKMRKNQKKTKAFKMRPLVKRKGRLFQVQKNSSNNKLKKQTSHKWIHICIRLKGKKLCRMNKKMNKQLNSRKENKKIKPEYLKMNQLRQLTRNRILH